MIGAEMRPPVEGKPSLGRLLRIRRWLPCDAGERPRRRKPSLNGEGFFYGRGHDAHDAECASRSVKSALANRIPSPETEVGHPIGLYVVFGRVGVQYDTAVSPINFQLAVKYLVAWLGLTPSNGVWLTKNAPNVVHTARAFKGKLPVFVFACSWRCRSISVVALKGYVKDEDGLPDIAPDFMRVARYELRGKVGPGLFLVRDVRGLLWQWRRAGFGLPLRRTRKPSARIVVGVGLEKQHPHARIVASRPAMRPPRRSPRLRPSPLRDLRPCRPGLGR
jgi:hypothetical protein